MRKIQTSYTKSAHQHPILCVGDSLAYNTTYSPVAADYWPERVAVSLRALGAGVLGYNMGSSGRTSGQMLANIAYGLLQGNPALTAIYAGTNDPQYNTTVQASPAPTTTTFPVGTGLGANYQPGTYLTVGGTSALIASVAGDVITLAAPLGGAPSVGATVAIDTATNIKAIASWAKGYGCTKFLVFGEHFYNFASSGDTTSAQLAANASLRTTQQAAVTAINGLGGVTAVYVDLYAYMSALITNATPVSYFDATSGTTKTQTFAQGDNGWHVAASNLHLNAVGQQILANAASASVQAQTGWLTALS